MHRLNSIRGPAAKDNWSGHAWRWNKGDAKKDNEGKSAKQVTMERPTVDDREHFCKLDVTQEVHVSQVNGKGQSSS